MFAETCTQAIGAGYGGGEDIVRQVKSTTQQASVKQYSIYHLRWNPPNVQS